jgi:hypothetical protein
VRFDVLTAVRMTMSFSWVLTPCRLVGRYQRFGETYCLHIKAEVAMLENGGICIGSEEGNAGIYLRVYTASKPRKTTSSNVMFPPISSVYQVDAFECVNLQAIQRKKR